MSFPPHGRWKLCQHSQRTGISPDVATPVGDEDAIAGVTGAAFSDSGVAQFAKVSLLAYHNYRYEITLVSSKTCCTASSDLGDGRAGVVAPTWC